MIVLPLCILAMAEGTDRDYMEWLFREHYRLMMATAWRFVRQSYDADEIVSESLMALYRKIDKIRHMKQNSLRLYIISTVRNTSLNYLKKHQRMNSQFFHVSDMVIGQLPSEENLEKKIVLSEELDQVRIAIRQLPERERMAVQLKLEMNLTDAEISEIMGINADSVRRYVYRGKEHIRLMVYQEEKSDE